MPKSNRKLRKPEPLDIVDDRALDVDGDIAYSFESPESSTIEQAMYDEETQVMRVTFRRAKGATDTYQYEGIPPTLWADFYAAPSKGSFFTLNIRPHYVGKH